jgi:choloylglycine hydrolase
MCTNFLLQAGSGFVNGRSMEFGMPLHSAVFRRPAGHHYTQLLSGPGFGFSWTGKYGFVGLNGGGIDIAADGLNSEGLATGCLWLVSTQYQTITDAAKGLCVDYFVEWILSSFATCAEVQAAIEAGTVQVAPPVALKGFPPLHFPVHDAAGHSIVIEFVEGEIVVNSDPVGVCTNDPIFPWHLQNLRNYTGVTHWDAGSADLGGYVVTQSGHGSGLMHLPADPTPPSRFVKVAMIKSLIDPPADLDAGINTAFHILNTVDIPRGLVRYKKDLVLVESDYTQWCVVKDLTRRTYTTRFYEDLAPVTHAVAG